MEKLNEDGVQFYAPVGKVSKDLSVFYNPVMKFNRDVSVALVSALGIKHRIGLPMEGTGIRGIRFLLNGASEVYFNDLNSHACELMKKNLKLNGVSGIVSCLDANDFILGSKGFDYIDIDPFGTPVPFLDSAVKRLSRDGILAVTATDTGALCGSFFSACVRKYWGKPLRNHLMHEVGLRILIRRVQLIGASFEKALVPVLSYSKDHYMRVFFRCSKGKKEADKIMKQHGEFLGAGPMWLGSLCDNKVLGLVLKKFKHKLLETLLCENKVGVVGFYDLHVLCRKYNIAQLSKIDNVMESVISLGYKCSRTHFNDWGLRSDISEEKLVSILKLF